MTRPRPFRDTALPSTATIPKARELAKELGCTHVVRTTVITRPEPPDYLGNVTVVLALHFGSFSDSEQRHFLEAFMVGVDGLHDDPRLRNVHDFRAVRAGGREWNPGILAAHSTPKPL